VLVPPRVRFVRPALGPFLDAAKLVFSEGLEGTDPAVDRFKLLGVQPIDRLMTAAAHVDEAHLSQDPQVLGDLRLGQVEAHNHVVGRPLAPSEQVEDLSPPWFGDRVESV
jgi:hypothetical protein